MVDELKEKREACKDEVKKPTVIGKATSVVLVSCVLALCVAGTIKLVQILLF